MFAAAWSWIDTNWSVPLRVLDTDRATCGPAVMRYLLATPLLLGPVAAYAQPTPTAEPAQPATPAPIDEPPVKITVGGYIETYYQAHFQNPSNRITNLRGFDNRSRTFTLENVALDLKGEKGPLAAHIIFQVGAVGSTAYLSEPVHLGTPSVNASTGELWKYLQTATITAQLPSDWALEGGLFPSPVGIEVFPIKDNINWSRSNLFFGLPFYHTGVRVSHPLAAGWTGTLFVNNGWNSVVDNNKYPSVSAYAAYASERTTAQVLYFGGIERPTGSPLGQPWRNLFDAYAQYALTDTVTLAGQFDAGFEPNNVGTDWWIAGAVYGKVAVLDELYAAVRVDYFYEGVPEEAGVPTGGIFWPSPWVAEATATLAYQPVANVSARLEYRHDQADGDSFFGGDVAVDPVTLQFIPDRETQDTLTLGLTAWF